MNVKVINGSGLPMWVLVAAFLVVNTGTLAIPFLWNGSRPQDKLFQVCVSSDDLQTGIWDT
jgi:hypothetical protein